jgi:hypothetical protein
VTVVTETAKSFAVAHLPITHSLQRVTETMNKKAERRFYFCGLSDVSAENKTLVLFLPFG